MNRIVYTAIAGGYDELKPLPYGICQSVMCIAFLDDVTRERTSDPGGWIIERLHSEEETSLLQAKRCKVLADRVLPSGTGSSLWVDGAVRISDGFDIDRGFDECLAGHDLALFNHPRRHCIYDEAETCTRFGLDDSDVIGRQVAGYRLEGYPEGNGLAMAGIIFRRHTPEISDFNSRWWDEIKGGSTRDQLSLDHVAWKMGLRYNRMLSSRVRYESRDPGGNAFVGGPLARADFLQSVHRRPRRII